MGFLIKFPKAKTMTIFDEQVSRKPNHYLWTQDFIDRMWAGHWTPNEFDFKADYNQFQTELTPQEQQVIVRTLSAIGQIEIAVKKFWARLGDTLPHPSLVDLGLTMASIEVIHNQAYEKLLEVLHLSDVFSANLKEDVIAGRVTYLRKYLDRNYHDNRKQFVYSLILFTLFVENVSLFSQFYIILWFNRFHNVLKDTAQQVKYTKNEETLHALSGIRIIQTIRQEFPELFDAELEERIHQEAEAAYEAEVKVIAWILGDYDQPSLNQVILSNYVAGRINDSLAQIGFQTTISADPELEKQTEWMDVELYGNAMTDFFHARPIEYSKNNRSFNAEDLF